MFFEYHVNSFDEREDHLMLCRYTYVKKMAETLFFVPHLSYHNHHYTRDNFWEVYGKCPPEILISYVFSGGK